MAGVTAGPVGREELRRLMGGHLQAVPEPRRPEVAVEDHPAVARAVRLIQALRERDPDLLASLAGRWSHVETLEVACLLAALVPTDVDVAASLVWLDLPVGEWPEPVLAWEAHRWDAGDRDATAVAACEERGRRGLS